MGMNCTETKVVGGFWLDGPVLGEGLSSKVVLATDSGGNQVAIKIINKATLSESSRKLLDQEIKILKRVSNNQTNIIKLIGVIEQENFRYVVQEYIEGGDLFEYVLKQREGLVEKRVKKIFYQMCKGVQYLHQHYIVHHDLKLENTGIRTNGTVAIMDILIIHLHGTQ